MLQLGLGHSNSPTPRVMLDGAGTRAFEAWLVATHPAVAECAVIGVPSERWGETPVAFVTLKPAGAEGAAALQAHANARLGRFQRVSEVRIVAELPRSPIGKILKRALRTAG